MNRVDVLSRVDLSRYSWTYAREDTSEARVLVVPEGGSHLWEEAELARQYEPTSFRVEVDRWVTRLSGAADDRVVLEVVKGRRTSPRCMCAGKMVAEGSTVWSASCNWEVLRRTRAAAGANTPAI